MIDTKQMEAILCCIEFIRARHHTDNLIFLPTTEQPNVKILISMIKSGSQDIQEFLSSSCTVRECTAALFSFLRSLNEGLLPIRAQQLIKSHNTNVPFKTIALDTLGCIIEESRNQKQTNFIITIELLKMMRILSTIGSLKPTEINSSQAPYFLMPILFDKNLSTDIIMNFSQCMNIVNEIILHSSLISPNYHAAWRELRELEATQQQQQQQNFMSFQLHDSLNYEVDILGEFERRARTHALQPHTFHLQSHLFRI